ncbi:MAG: hypothetical protein KAV87_29670 [Desulfobacteraceae bacterium]|nr:hypothetical protein [Desulfobacteraceae bacterium]
MARSDGHKFLEGLSKVRYVVGFSDDLRLLVSREVEELIFTLADRSNVRFEGRRRKEYMGVPFVCDERLEGFDFEFVKFVDPRPVLSVTPVGEAAFSGE